MAYHRGLAVTDSCRSEWGPTLVAKRRELRVSWKHSSRGDTLTNISILLLPPRQFCSRWVSLLLR